MMNEHSDARPRVRFGGMETPGGYLFELTGGRLCLDFANTLDNRGTDRERELLRSAADLFDWARQAGALPARDVGALERHAAAHPRLAASALARAIEFRERLFAVFSALAAGRPLPVDSLAAIDRVAGAAAATRRLEARGRGAAWVWETGAPSDLDAILWRVAWSAAETLTTPDAGRVKQCEGAGCRWLFLDTSRNRTRRWCDMTVCGNRTKARRHHAKRRARPLGLAAALR